MELLQLRLVGGGLHDELGLLFGQVGSLRLDGRDEQLILEAALGDRKVEQRHLDRDLGRVVWVGDDGGERELEVGVERDHVLAELDHERATRVLVSLVGEHRIEEGVERLDDVLDEHRGAQPDGHLKGLHDLLGRVARLDSLDLHLRLRELEETVSLPLWVDHERPALGDRHDDAVLDAERVRGQSVHIPLAHLDRVSQDLVERAVGRVPDANLFELREPLAGERGAVGRRERAHV